MKRILTFKTTICEEDNLILLHKNCDNCGAPLKYNKQNMNCKCDYCNTEYYIAQNGEFKGQLIKLKLHGEDKLFYIGSEEIKYLYNDCYRNQNSQFIKPRSITKEVIKLIEI